MPDPDRVQDPLGDRQVQVPRQHQAGIEDRHRNERVEVRILEIGAERVRVAAYLAGCRHKDDGQPDVDREGQGERAGATRLSVLICVK